MSKDQLIAEILRLPIEQQRRIIEQVIDHFPDSAPDPDMTPELRAESEPRYQNVLDHPENEVSWEEASAKLDRRAEARRKSASK